MENVKKGALLYLGKLILQRALGFGLFVLAAGTALDVRANVYFAVYFLACVVSWMVLQRTQAEMLNARRKVPQDTEKWDKLLLLLYVLLAYYGIYMVGGLAVRWGLGKTPGLLYGAGMLLMVVSCLLTVLPVLENRNFESSVRLQEDRGHAVCTTGPYAVVRHPGYSALVLWAVAMPMMFGWLVGIVSFCIVVLLVVRTRLEDDMLQKKLEGYADYAKTVRYRLVPCVW